MQHKKAAAGNGGLPRLLILVPCIKAIIDNDDNLVSVIDILPGLTLAPGDSETPGESKSNDLRLVPIPWHVLTLWKRMDAKVATFIQTLEIVDPNGEKLLSHDVEFSTEYPTLRVRLRNRHFPVTVPGEYWVKAFVRSAGAKRKSEAGRYPLNIKFSDQVPVDDKE